MTLAAMTYRALDPADATRADSSQFTLRADLPVALDPRVPTDDFASTDVVMLLVRSAREDGADAVVPAGTTLRVHGHRAYTHHLASAVDVEVTVLLLAEEGVEEADAEFTRAMLMLGMSMASGPSGRGQEAARFAGALPV